MAEYMTVVKTLSLSTLRTELKLLTLKNYLYRLLHCRNTAKETAIIAIKFDKISTNATPVPSYSNLSMKACAYLSFDLTEEVDDV